MFASKVLKGIIIAGTVFTLVGCASSGKGKHAANAGSGIGDVARFYGEDITPEQERQLLNTNTLYFGFDQFTINEDDKRVIYAHAKKMLENPSLKLRLDGHTDNRGSRAYNLGLGERRSKAVANILELKGVAEDRISTTSYGKEKPAALGDNEESWRLNRRAEFNYEERG